MLKNSKKRSLCFRSTLADNSIAASCWFMQCSHCFPAPCTARCSLWKAGGMPRERGINLAKFGVSVNRPDPKSSFPGLFCFDCMKGPDCMATQWSHFFQRRRVHCCLSSQRRQHDKADSLIYTHDPILSEHQHDLFLQPPKSK